MTSQSLPLVELYGKPDCHLCDDAKTLLRQLQNQHPFILREINILQHACLAEQYAEDIPVIFINGRKAFKYSIEPQQFVRQLNRERGKSGHRLWQRFRPW